MNLLEQIRKSHLGFRVLRDEPMVFEFEFNFGFSSLPNTTGRQEVVIFVSCPLAGSDLLLPGSDIRIQRRCDNEILEAPPSWKEDKEKIGLRRIIEDLLLMEENDRVTPKEEQIESPLVAPIRDRLDEIACQAGKIMAESSKNLSLPDLLLIHTSFSLRVIEVMFNTRNQEDARNTTNTTPDAPVASTIA